VKPIEELLQSFQFYYSEPGSPRRYGKVVRETITERFSYFPQYFIVPVYDAVVSIHPIRFGLPDVAVITKAVDKLDRPETYKPPGYDEPALPEPDSQDYRREIEQTTKAIASRDTSSAPPASAKVPYTIDMAIASQREKIRAKGRDMSKDESHTLFCNEYLDGNFREMERRYPRETWTVDRFFELEREYADW
jgi:hypothetical protein